MNLIEATLFILFIAIISVPIANRFRLPLEIFLIIGSYILTLLPGVPNYQIEPMIVFNLFLPPILFYAAYFTSWQDFKLNLRPISMMAFGLVIFTMLLVGATAKLIFAQLSWSEGFLLGAIISPTDAASATAIIKKLGAPRRLITILEGESLVNDATALMLFKFFLGALFIGDYSITSTITEFFYISIGGIILGLLIGFLTIRLLNKIKSIPAETTLTFVAAFSCYLLGEALGFSGVITTVVGGIYFGLHFPELSASKTRINTKASWNTLLFIINGIVFSLIGLELPFILKHLQSESIGNLVYYGVAISTVVILSRFIWVFAVTYLTRLLTRIFFPRIYNENKTPSWQALFVLSWSGMRGIVSLAAALSLPYQLSPDTTFPHRELFLFTTYCVIVATLIIPTITLPIFLRFFRLDEDDESTQQEAKARISSLTAALEGIMEIDNTTLPPHVLEDFTRHIKRRLEMVKTQTEVSPYSTLHNDFFALKKLISTAIASERKTLLELRKAGEIRDEVFHALSDELDIEEMRSKTMRI